MSLAFSLPGRYAKSLLEYDSLDHDFKTVLSAFDQDYNLGYILASNFIKKGHLIDIIGIFEEKLSLSKPFTSFLKVLVQNRRISLLPDIYRCYQTLWNRKYKLRPVTVKTAYPLSDLQKTKAVTILKTYFSEQMIVDYKEDKSLLGGILIESNGYRIDATLDQQINALGRAIRA